MMCQLWALATAILLLLVVYTGAQNEQLGIKSREDCEEQFHAMDDTQILLQLAPCQQSISEECCERVGGNLPSVEHCDGWQLSLVCIPPYPQALLNIFPSKAPPFFHTPNKHRA
jgi:hypothetical protein